MLDNSYGATFYFFSLIENLKMDERFETYGSDGFKVQFLHNERGKLIKTDKLFCNLYDFCVIQHASGFMKTFEWYHPKGAKIEKILQKKWEKKRRLTFNKCRIKENKGGR